MPVLVSDGASRVLALIHRMMTRPALSVVQPGASVLLNFSTSHMQGEKVQTSPQARAQGGAEVPAIEKHEQSMPARM